MKERTMKTSTRIRRRRLWIAAALASALVVAPAAQARPDEGGAGAVDRPVPIVQIQSDGFDWVDAGIGAGGAAGLALLAVTAATLGQRRQGSVNC
jgi:hypothetical protein